MSETALVVIVRVNGMKNGRPPATTAAAISTPRLRVISPSTPSASIAISAKGAR